MNDDIEDRLREVESRLAHYERMSEDLSAVVAEQAETIRGLQRRLAALTGKILDMQHAQDPAPSDLKPPPHY